MAQPGARRTARSLLCGAACALLTGCIATGRAITERPAGIGGFKELSFALQSDYDAGADLTAVAGDFRAMRELGVTTWRGRFAWADLEVKKAELALVQKMAKKLALDDDERAMVKEWLTVPPRAEDVDPQSIPPAQRKMFLDAAKEMIAIDGEIFQDAWLEPIPPEAEVHVIPQIVGG